MVDKMNTIIFFARAFLGGVRGDRSLSLMTIVCWMSIFIGSCALALVIAIMHGFEQATHTTLKGIHTDIIIKSYGAPLNSDALKTALTPIKTIKATCPRAQHHAILGTQTIHTNNVVIVTGIDPLYEEQASNLQAAIIHPAGTRLSTLLTTESILIGQRRAKSMRLEPGDTTTIHFVDPEDDQPTGMEEQEVIIAGTFKTGIDEFDANVIICSLTLFEELFGNRVQTLGIRVQPGTEQATLAAIKKIVGKKLKVFTWQQLYPAVLSALALEKYALILILALIILVASMSIMSLLYMLITQKQRDIAILQSMGMSLRSVQAIFATMGGFLVITATIAGLICATLAAYAIERIHICVPDVYYIDHIPAHVTLGMYVQVISLIMLLSSIALLVPLARIRSMRIGHILRLYGD